MGVEIRVRDGAGDLELWFAEVLGKQPYKNLRKDLSRALKLSAIGTRTCLSTGVGEYERFFLLIALALRLVKKHEPQLYKRLGEVSLEGIEGSLLEELLKCCLCSPAYYQGYIPQPYKEYLLAQLDGSVRVFIDMLGEENE